MQVIRIVIMAVAVGDAPDACVRDAAIGGDYRACSSESKRVPAEMIGFILTGIYKGGNSPGAVFHIVFDDHRGQVVRLSIGAGCQGKQGR